MAFDFDLLVLGSGPGGQKAAIAGAKLGRRIGTVERRHMVGGVCIKTGTIPSKTLREAVYYVTGLSQRELHGQAYRLKEEITVGDLTAYKVAALDAMNKDACGGAHVRLVRARAGGRR